MKITSILYYLAAAVTKKKKNTSDTAIDPDELIFIKTFEAKNLKGLSCCVLEFNVEVFHPEIQSTGEKSEEGWTFH